MTTRVNNWSERGQSTVEVALVLPFVVLLLFLVVQVGLIVHDQTLVTYAAREAARAASVSNVPSAPRRAAIAGGGLDPGRVRVEVHGRGAIGSYLEVSITYVAVTDLVLIGPLLPDLALHAEATMRVEN